MSSSGENNTSSFFEWPSGPEASRPAQSSSLDVRGVRSLSPSSGPLLRSLREMHQREAIAAARKKAEAAVAPQAVAPVTLEVHDGGGEAPGPLEGQPPFLQRLRDTLRIHKAHGSEIVPPAPGEQQSDQPIRPVAA